MGIQVTRSGTNWTVDVTALGLVLDTSEKDFLVVIDKIEQPPAAYIKTTATVITYSGAALPTNTLISFYRWGVRDVDQLEYGEVTSQLGMNKRLTQIERVLDDIREVKQFIWAAVDGNVAVASHVAQADPHTQYRLKSAAIPEIVAAITSHEAAVDPHPTYTTAAELLTALTGYLPTSQKGAVNGIAPLDGTSKVPVVNSRGCNASYAGTTGVWTFTWADGAIQTVDTPLELVFQSVNYNTTTKQVTFTLVGGATTSFSLADLVDLPELQVAVTDPVATPTTGQRMYLRSDNGSYWVSGGTTWVGPYLPFTTAERNKLAGVQAGATANSSDVALLSRNNHTGTQPLNTITGVSNLAAAGVTAAEVKTAAGIPLVENVRLSLSATGGLEIAVDANSSGSNWVAVGTGAGQKAGSGSSWVAIGDSANSLGVSNSFTIAIGQYAGFSNSSGNYWAAIGTSAGQNNTVGGNWLAVGLNAGFSSTVGESWQAFGLNAGYSNTTGSGWIAQGFYAGFSSTTGSDWIAIGTYSAFDVTTGAGNITIGYQAGRGITSGSNNVIIGNNVLGLPAAMSDTFIVGTGDGVKLTSDSSGTKIGTNSSNSKLKLIAPDGTVFAGSISNSGVLTFV